MVHNEEGTNHRLTMDSCAAKRRGNTLWQLQSFSRERWVNSLPWNRRKAGNRKSQGQRLQQTTTRLVCVDNLRWLNIVRTWTRWSEFSIGDLEEWNWSVREDLEVIGDDPVTVESNVGSQCLSVDSVPVNYLGWFRLACLLWDRSGIGLKTSDSAITVV